MDNLRDLVLKNIEDTGFLNQIRAQLKLQVFKVVENQDEVMKTKTGFQWDHPQQTQLKTMAHGINSLQVIIEYLEFFKFDYTAQVLRKEANMTEPLIRESLATKIGLQGKLDSMRPLLIVLLGEVSPSKSQSQAPTNVRPNAQQEKEKQEKEKQEKEKQEKEKEKQKQVPVVVPKKQPEPVKQVVAKVVEPVKVAAAPQSNAVNKIRGAKPGSSAISNMYGFDFTKQNSSGTPYDDLLSGGMSAGTSDPYAFDLGGGMGKSSSYAFDIDEQPKKTVNKFNSFDLNPKNKKNDEVEEDIDDFMESRDDRAKQSNGMFTSSEDMMRATQSLGVDESVDSLALEDYDYYEDVTKKR